MNILSRYIQSFKHLLGYGYAVSFFHALFRTRSFVEITKEAVYSTYQDKANSVADALTLGTKDFSYLGFYYQIPIQNDKMRALMISSSVQSDGRVLKIGPEKKISVSKDCYTLDDGGRSKFTEEMNEIGIFVVPVEDTMLTNLPIELIIRSTKQAGLKGI